MAYRPPGKFPPELGTYVIELTVRETDYPSNGPDSFASTAEILAGYAREMEGRISTGYRGRLEVTANQVRFSGRPEPTASPAGTWTIESAIRQTAHGEPGDRTEDAALFLYEQIQQYVNDKSVLLAAATAVMMLDEIKIIRQERN